jgi:hypothetical protein
MPSWVVINVIVLDVVVALELFFTRPWSRR